MRDLARLIDTIDRAEDPEADNAFAWPGECHSSRSTSVEPVICCRFKRRGMRWTQWGAHQILKLLESFVVGCETVCFEDLNFWEALLTDT